MVQKQRDVKMQKKVVIPHLTPYIKMSSKCIKNLNVGAKAIKFLEKNVGANFHDFGFNKRFLNRIKKV